MQPCVYIVSNHRYGTLYIGVTSDIARRAYEHKKGLIDGFSRRYGLKRLIWYELHENMEAAIAREKQMKAWQRSWKIKTIEKVNPVWADLYDTLNT
ncbi:MAG: GIY-YIG nuclease family protein [Anderseniella sp.]|jgi:putative endonuclease|nr:GIY-YIG nuclease family protein [Anderseniella sp.]